MSTESSRSANRTNTEPQECAPTLVQRAIEKCEQPWIASVLIGQRQRIESLQAEVETLRGGLFNISQSEQFVSTNQMGEYARKVLFDDPK